MVDILRAQHEVRLKLNKLNTNSFVDLPNAYIDDQLEEALYDFIDIFYSGNQIKANKLGFEVTQQRTDMLSHFIEPKTLLPTSTTLDRNLIKNTFSLPDNYLHLIDLYGTSKCGILNVKIEQHDDLQYVLSNEFTAPKNRWKRAIGIFEDNKMIVYSETNLTDLFIKYLRKPIKPFSGNYNTLEFINGDTTYPSSSSPKQNLDIARKYFDIVIDIAVQNISGIMSDYNHVQYLQNKISTTT